MATYTLNSRMTKIDKGDETGTWGDTVNTTLDHIDASMGYVAHALAADADETLTISDGADSNARYMFLDVTGTTTVLRVLTLAPNTLQKMWFIRNSTTGGFGLDISQGSGANVTVANGETKMVFGDGAGSGAAMGDILASQTLTALTVTTVDINGGTVDGAVIGGASAAAGTFTTLDATGNVNLGQGTVTIGAASVGVLALGGLSSITGAPTWGSSQAITLSTAAQASVTSLGTLTALTVNGAATVSTANGIDINPGSDIDTDLITVGVTGAPRLWWDESESAWVLDNATFYVSPGIGNPFEVSSANGVVISSRLAHTGSTLGLYGTTPIARQTGVAVSAAAIHAALVNLGLITA